MYCVIFFTSCEDKTQKIFLFRHAEKIQTDSTDNPELTVEGDRQAIKIADILKNEGITALYTTKYKRNLATVQPLINETKAKVYYYEWDNWSAVLDSINKRNDIGVAVCGHGDILLPMIEKFGAVSPQKTIGKNEYKTIYELSISSSQSIVTVNKFK